MAGWQQTFSPIDGALLAERELLSAAQASAAAKRARKAQPAWAARSVDDRCDVVARFAECFKARTAEIAGEITLQMGRPIRDAPGEVNGVLERTAYMREVAPGALATIHPGHKPGFRRFIQREPVGVVLVLAPWNYPYLTAVNAVVPALLAGNAVLLKHSAQTPLCAERLHQALKEAGLPDDLFQVLHMDHATLGGWLQQGEVDHIAFTGSVAGGIAVSQAAATKRTSLGLELGGKDPAYVRADADLQRAVEGTVDGVLYNSGQSCCAVERIYVHEKLFKPFVEGFVDLARSYVLGDPRDVRTTLGPLVRTSAASVVREQVAEAVALGARTLIDTRAFAADRFDSPYVAPQVLIDVHHGMRLMREETFGPAVGIAMVRSDEEAVTLMNDSDYGLTASLWTRDEEAALNLGCQLQTGTVFMNRCDYLDPALAWTGVKDSGRGCTLSRLGFDAFTRPKSFHLRR